MQESPLRKYASRSPRFPSSVLFVPGALNAWSAQAMGNYGAVSTALCVCDCAAGRFGEDMLQRGYCRDRDVLAHVGVHPGAATRQANHAIEDPERVAVRILVRLTDDGLLVLVTDGATPALRSYRLAS